MTVLPAIVVVWVLLVLFDRDRRLRRNLAPDELDI